MKSVDLRGRKVLPVGAGPRRTPERRKFLLAGVVWGAVKIKKKHHRLWGARFSTQFKGVLGAKKKLYTNVLFFLLFQDYFDRRKKCSFLDLFYFPTCGESVVLLCARIRRLFSRKEARKSSKPQSSETVYKAPSFSIQDRYIQEEE